MDRYLKLLFTFFGILSTLFLQAQNAVEDFASNKELKGALISVQVSDIVTGEVLESWNPDQRLCPASVWKLFTTSAALDRLGANFQFKTILAYDGLMTGDTLHGNVYIIGGGDPTLGSRFFDKPMHELMNSWASQIAAAGIGYVDGKVIANSAHFRGSAMPNTRIWEDMGNYYGGAVSGLNISDNTYFIRYQIPDTPGELATIKEVSPNVPNLNLSSEVLSSERRGDQAYIFGAPGSNDRTVKGTLPAGKKEYSIKGSVPDVPMFAAFHLSKVMKDKGILVRNGIGVETLNIREPATLKIITIEKSPKLSEIISQINKRSDNLFAEALLMQLGVKTSDPTIEGGIEEIDSYFKEICAEDCKFYAYDGSGLSRFTSVSASQVSSLLHAAYMSQEQKRVLLNELPIAGKEGSMKWFGKRSNLEGNVQAKSGSMEKVKAYAGQMTAFSGRQLSFAVIVNNFDGSGGEVKAKIEHLLLSLYGDY